MSDQSPPRPDSSKDRLERALGDISPSEMSAVRAEVQGEIAALANVSVPSLRPGARTSPESQQGQKPPATERSTLTNSDIEGLERAGKIATDFLTGMDRITDVLMLLVLKFGRASTLMRAVFLGNIFVVLLLAGSIIAIWNLSGSQTALQEAQGKIQRQQALILERQGATQLVAGEAKQKAEAAEQKATEVQQKAPEVVVDAQGRPQLILKVQNPEEGKKATKVVQPPKKSQIKDGNGKPKTLEVPLPF